MLEKWVEELRSRRVVVLGDLVADEYVYGMTSRISREAPVLVVRYQANEYRLGGAANAAHNVAVLGGIAVPIGVIGDDEAGGRVVELCERGAMPVSGLVRGSRPTSVKTRILAGSVHTTKQQVLRLDRENSEPYGDEIEQKVEQALDRELEKADALLVSDYGLGLMSPRLIERALRYAKSGGLVCVDSRYNLHAYVGATAVTPNEPEAEAAVRQTIDNDADVARAGKLLLELVACKAVLITRGRQGMSVFEPTQGPRFLPISGSDQVADVTGAGDTVIATFTLALAAGAPPYEAAQLANAAAGVSVMKAGAATVSPEELVRALGR